ASAQRHGVCPGNPQTAGRRERHAAMPVSAGMAVAATPGSAAASPAALVAGFLALAEEFCVAGHLALGVVLAQVLHVDLVVGHAAAEAGGLHCPFPECLQSR